MNRSKTLLWTVGCGLFGLPAASFAAAMPAEEKNKESGYVVRLTDTHVMLSKVPVRSMQMKSGETAPSPAAGAASATAAATSAGGDRKGEEEKGQARTMTFRRPATAGSEASGAQGDSKPIKQASKTSFSINMYRIDDKTIIEKGVEQGLQVTAHFREQKEEGEQKVVARIELLKP